MKKKFFATIIVAVLLVMSTTIFASAKNYSNWFDLDRINAVDVETNLKNEATREEVALMVAYMCDSFDSLPSKAVLDFEDEDDFESRSSYKTITKLSSTGIVNGYPDGTFGPENDITRAEALTIILRMVDYLSIETESYRKGSSFTDTEGHWAEVYIERAYEQGLVSGRGNGRFYPQDNITREEVITILVNLMGESNNPLIEAIDEVYDLEFDNSYYEEDEDDDEEDDDRSSRYDEDEDDYEEATKRPVIDLDDYEDEDDEEDNDDNHSSKPQRPIVVLEENEDEDDEEDDDNDRPSRPVVNISNNTSTSSSKPSRPVVDTTSTNDDSSNRTSRPVVDTTTTNDRPTVVVDSGDNEGSSNRPSRPRV